MRSPYSLQSKQRFLVPHSHRRSGHFFKARTRVRQQHLAHQGITPPRGHSARPSPQSRHGPWQHPHAPGHLRASAHLQHRVPVPQPDWLSTETPASFCPGHTLARSKPRPPPAPHRAQGFPPSNLNRGHYMVPTPLDARTAPHGVSLATPSPQLGTSGVDRAACLLPDPPSKAPTALGSRRPDGSTTRSRSRPGAQTCSRALPEGVGNRSTRAVKRIPTKLQE